jgi:hypothetical protein
MKFRLVTHKFKATSSAQRTQAVRNALGSVLPNSLPPPPPHPQTSYQWNTHHYFYPMNWNACYKVEDQLRTCVLAKYLLACPVSQCKGHQWLDQERAMLWRWICIVPHLWLTSQRLINASMVDDSFNRCNCPQLLISSIG